MSLFVWPSCCLVVWLSGLSYMLSRGSSPRARSSGYVLVYLRQTSNELTGEHTAIMLKALESEALPSNAWLQALSADFSHRLIHLFAYAFREFDPYLALSVVENGRQQLIGDAAGAEKLEDDDDDAAAAASTAVTTTGAQRGVISSTELAMFLTPHDLKRLDAYSRNLVRCM